MKKILLFAVLLFNFFGGVLAQDNKASDKTIDKTTLTLRPNSREYAPVRKTNMHQRMEMRRDRTIMIQQDKNLQNQLGKGIERNEKVRQPINRSAMRRRNQQEIIKRQQQRILRRKMILQQQRKIRRR